MERSLFVCTDDIAVMQHDIQRLTAEFNKLETKCEDLEARSRRDNVRIISVPEGPNSSTISSVAALLRKALSLEKERVLDRSHCTLQPVPKPGRRASDIHRGRRRFLDLCQGRHSASDLSWSQRCSTQWHFTASYAVP
ncbi:hypothetical protein HF521_003884 [Silurus meridionalis]|uniref:Uncharacterized protein n=1 Tax=Silurus meridionalis TaxID=175797 RepID=A0A8T0B2B5_SILME|nr:hypothetical protein HF521_003884 [Silurus meridionalis]